MKLTKQILVLDKEKYIFFLAPKCASSSVRRMAIFDLGYGEPLTYITDLNGLNLYKDFTWVYLVRDPWERIRSLWKDKVYRICHGDFRKLAFRGKMSFDIFAKKYKKIPNLIEQGAHLWPMTCLFSEFLKGNKKLIVDIKDWKNWPDDLLPPRKDNVNSIVIPKEKDNLSRRGKAILQNSYRQDFTIYNQLKRCNFDNSFKI